MYLLSGLFGAILGAAIARKRRGKGLDMAQYAAGYGMPKGPSSKQIAFILGYIELENVALNCGVAKET